MLKVLAVAGTVAMLGAPWMGAAAQSAPTGAEPVALVTELVGSGSVTQKLDGGNLEPMHELLPGAVVTLNGAARAVVVHTASGAVFELSGPGRYRVQARTIEALQGARLVHRELPPEIRAFQLKPLSAMQASIVMRSASPAQLNGPNGGVLGADELNYRLSGKMNAPQLDVLDADGVVIARAKEPRAGFNPAQVAALQPGKRYVIVVKGTNSNGGPVELTSRFWLIDVDLAARLKVVKPEANATTTDLIVYAMALESAGATATARTLWVSINERR
jgi:hypothetical protein